MNTEPTTIEERIDFWNHTLSGLYETPLLYDAKYLISDLYAQRNALLKACKAIVASQPEAQFILPAVTHEYAINITWEAIAMCEEPK